MQKEEVEETKKTEKASWVKMKPAELEKIVKELAEQGNTPAKIGLILRDQHGIPKAKLLGKKITSILKDSGVKYISEKDAVSKKIERLKEHSEKNKYDNSAKRSLAKQLWVLYRLNKENKESPPQKTAGYSLSPKLNKAERHTSV